MKKLIFTAVLALGSLTAINAQDKAIAQVSTDEATVSAEAPTVAVQDYKEIKATELPKPVLEAVAKEFEGATVSKAYKNEKGEYKIVLATADKAEQTVYANSKGEWIKKQ
tara:strand:- start:18037 stop:18366 length:330 start_codon:yes stop_codon:yes gene_type:complete